MCLVLCVPNVLIYDFKSEILIPASIGFTLNSVLIALMIPYISSSQVLNKLETIFIGKFIFILSQYSYCIYLIHVFFYQKVVDKGSVMSPKWWLQILSCYIFIFLISYLSFRFFETPILRYRDKLSDKLNK